MRRSSVFSRSWSRYSLSRIAPPVLTGGYGSSTGQRMVSHFAPFQEQLHPLVLRQEPAHGSRVTRDVSTLRRLEVGTRRAGSRDVLDGPTTSTPVFWIVRIAVSRPEPGPFTTTSTRRIPCSMARRAAVSAASCAANGVDLREPLKPTLPADAHAMVLPCWSVKVMIVLLNDDLMWAVPYATFLALALLWASSACCRLCHTTRSSSTFPG